MIKSLIYSFFIILMISSSCKEEVKPVTYSYPKIFTGDHQKTWKVVSQSESYSGVISSMTLDACAKDDSYTFYANAERQFDIASGIKKCYSDPEPDLVTDSWAFNNANATLTIGLTFFINGRVPYIVKKAADKEMVLELFIDDANTHSYLFTLQATSEK